MHNVKFRRLFLSFFLGACFVTLIGCIGMDVFGGRRPPLLLGEWSKVVVLVGSALLTTAIGYYAVRTGRFRRGPQEWPFASSERLEIWVVMMLVVAFGPYVFETLPASMRAYSYTMRFSLGYLVWMGMVVVAGLECMRRFGRAKLWFVFGLCVLLFSLDYVRAYPGVSVSFPPESVFSYTMRTYQSFHFFSFIVFVAFFAFRARSIVKRHERIRPCVMHKDLRGE